MQWYNDIVHVTLLANVSSSRQFYMIKTYVQQGQQNDFYPNTWVCFNSLHEGCVEELLDIRLHVSRAFVYQLLGEPVSGGFPWFVGLYDVHQDNIHHILRERTLKHCNLQCWKCWNEASNFATHHYLHNVFWIKSAIRVHHISSFRYSLSFFIIQISLQTSIV